MRVELSERWVRAIVGDVAVVDSCAPLLFWEEHFPVPSYAFDRDEVRMDLLRPATGDPATEPFFYLPRGPVSAWFDLVVEGRHLPNAAWVRDDPALGGRIVLSWQPGLVDHWLEEDEEVASHPRHPHKRVDALVSSRHVTVALDRVVLADSTDPVLLFETGLPTRYYLPRADVAFDRLVSSTSRSHCPDKGYAEEYWDASGAPGVAWSYPHPYPAVAAVSGRVAFYNELVDITLDGRPLPQPQSVFTRVRNRPTSA